MDRTFSRRRFLQVCVASITAERFSETAFAETVSKESISGKASDRHPLQEVGYSQVTMLSAAHLAQQQETHLTLMGLSNDSLLRPFRAMVGEPAPGEPLGGWYDYKADYDYKTGNAGLAPSATFGQWVSALSRNYASTGDPATRQKVLQLNQLYAQTICPAYYQNNRFPAYCFDKLVCGLMDSHRLTGDPAALPLLGATADAAQSKLPGHAVDRDTPWRVGKDISWNWDESYTLPENLYLASTMCDVGPRERYQAMAKQYLHDRGYFDPLSRGENVLGGKHAYSYVNALCSAMQAYMVGGSEKHLDAARNGFGLRFMIRSPRRRKCTHSPAKRSIKTAHRPLHHQIIRINYNQKKMKLYQTHSSSSNYLRQST